MGKVRSCPQDLSGDAVYIITVGVRLHLPLGGQLEGAGAGSLKGVDALNGENGVAHRAGLAAVAEKAVQSVGGGESGLGEGGGTGGGEPGTGSGDKLPLGKMEGDGAVVHIAAIHLAHTKKVPLPPEKEEDRER